MHLVVMGIDINFKKILSSQRARKFLSKHWAHWAISEIICTPLNKEDMYFLSKLEIPKLHISGTFNFFFFWGGDSHNKNDG